MPRRSFRSVCTELMGVLQERSKKRWLGSGRAPTECARYAISLSLRLAWKRCLGRTSAVSARNASAQPPNGGERTNQAFSVLGVRLKHGRGLWASSAVTLMNATLRDALGMWRGKLSGRLSVSHQDALHEVLGSRTGKSCVSTGTQRRSIN